MTTSCFTWWLSFVQEYCLSVQQSSPERILVILHIWDIVIIIVIVVIESTILIDLPLAEVSLELGR